MIEPTLFGDLRPPDDPPKNSAAPRVAPGAAQRLERTTNHHIGPIDDNRCADPPYRRRGPETSRQAAALARPEAASRRGQALAFIVGRGSHGATDHEIAEALGWQIPMTTPRRGELVRLGLVKDSGARRLSPWNRPSIVWVATEGGAN